MREILFRAVESHKGIWIYGNLLIGKNSEDWASIIPKENADEGQPLYEFEVYPETIGQYIGICDKKGKKIFDGDVVKGNFPYAEICVVVWSDKRCGFYLKPISKLGRASYDPYYKLNSAKLEIIGNIHDNPELLEGL